MGVIVENMREITRSAPRRAEWLVSGKRVPGFGATHTRIAGYTEARGDYAFVRHDPAYCMILVTESGHGRVVVDGEWVECSAGQAYVTAPRVPHAYHIKPGSRWRLHWVIYEETANLPTLAAGTPPRLVALRGRRVARHAVEDLPGKRGRAEPGALGLWAALVDRMVLRVLESEKAEPRLERLWAQVREDMGESGVWPAWLAAPV